MNPLMLPHLVVKVCFSSSLWPQAQLAIGHLLSVVPETCYSHGQYQHATHNCHGNKGDDCTAGALGNLGYLRETPCISPLGNKRERRVVKLGYATPGNLSSRLDFKGHSFHVESTLFFMTNCA